MAITFTDTVNKAQSAPDMVDVTAETQEDVVNYTNYMVKGDITNAKKLASKAAVKKTIFNAEKYNFIRNQIMAIQSFFYQCEKRNGKASDEIYSNAATPAGIADNAAKTTSNKLYSIGKIEALLAAIESTVSKQINDKKASTTTGYSSTKISSLIDNLSNSVTTDQTNMMKVWQVSVPKNTQSKFPWTQTVTVSGMLETYNPVWGIDQSDSSETAANEENKIQIKQIIPKKNQIQITYGKQPTVAFKLKGKGI